MGHSAERGFTTVRKETIHTEAVNTVLPSTIEHVAEINKEPQTLTEAIEQLKVSALSDSEKFSTLINWAVVFTDNRKKNIGEEEENHFIDFISSLHNLNEQALDDLVKTRFGLSLLSRYSTHFDVPLNTIVSKWLTHDRIKPGAEEYELSILLETNPQVCTGEVAEKLLEIAPVTVMRNLQKFPESFKEKAIRRSVEIAPYSVLYAIDSAPKELIPELATAVIESESMAFKDLLIRLEDLPQELRDRVAQRYMTRTDTYAQDELPSLLEYIHYFKDFNYIDFIQKFNRYDLGKILPFIQNFPPEQHVAVLSFLSENMSEYMAGSIAENIQNFSDIPIEETISALSEYRSARIGLLKTINLIQGINQEKVRSEVASVFFEEHDYAPILQNISHFPLQDRDDLVQKIIPLYGANNVVRSLDTYQNLSRETVQQLLNSLINKNFTKAVQINNSFTPPFNEKLSNFAAVVGVYGTSTLYEYYLSINGNDELFREKVQVVRKGLLTSDPESLHQLSEDPVLSEVGKSVVRFEDSQFGSHSSSEFTTTITRYLEHKNEYAPMPKEYIPQKIEVVQQRKEVDREAYTYSPEFIEKWNSILPDLKEAEACLTNPEKLVGLYMRFTTAIEQEKRDISEAASRVPNEKARYNLNTRMDQLDAIDLGSIKGMSAAFEKLYDRKKRPEMAECMRIYGLYAAFTTMTDENAVLPSFIDLGDTPTAADISRVIEFVQHVAHLETWEKNEEFASKTVQDGLSSLFHVKALEQELQTMGQGRGKKGSTQEIQIIPSRDILTEFSGHIGDACWASKYEILDRNPNITSLTFTSEEKVMGAALLIDTETSSIDPITGKGEELTIIRGLNPLEAVINKLDAESFVSALQLYVESIAMQRGRKVAIVIDDHSGGSSTNRPLLFAYLSGLKRSLTRVPGVRPENTTFNGYTIIQDTYYLPSSTFNAS